jgi:hypothetical protein
MAQYKTFHEGDSRVYKKSGVEYRDIVVNKVFQTQALYTGGLWTGTAGVDYEVVESHTSVNSLGTFRYGIRTNKEVIDTTLTTTGFSGDEDTDWENILI